MPGYVKKGLLIALGVIFLILGVIGLVLPFLQGILFIVIGVILLSIASARVRAWADQYTNRYPRIHHTVENVRAKIERMTGERS